MEDLNDFRDFTNLVKFGGKLIQGYPGELIQQNQKELIAYNKNISLNRNIISANYIKNFVNWGHQF